MERATKEKQVEELKQLIIGKPAVFLTDYKGMRVEEMYNLRRAFDKANTGYRVVKNTLAKLAIAGTPYEFLADGFTGTIGVAYSDDLTAPAKVLTEFAKKSDKLKLRIAYLDGKRIEPDQVEAVSKLPGKDDLRAMFLGVLKAPTSKFVGVLAAAPQKFIGVLSAREKALGQASA